MQTRLTKTTVEAIPAGPKDSYAWDDRVPGFGVKVTPKGARIYVLKYRFGGAARWLTLGRHGELTIEAARTKALQLRGRVASGEDPAEARIARAGAVTVGDLADRYLEEYAVPHKRPRSVEEDRRNLQRHVRPELGQLAVHQVGRQDILKLHHKLRATPVAANRVLALCSKFFSLAEEWGLRPEGSNPARRIKKFAERSRERFLSGDELQRLGAALAEAAQQGEHPSGLAIIRLLLLTGARLSEITTLEWSFIDFERKCLRLPESKTGAKVVRLAAPALDLLAGLPRFTSPFVFPSARKTRPTAHRGVGPGHFVGIQDIWQRVRARAGLDDVRLHDLRHSFASHSVMGGTSLYLTGVLLGHRSVSTTQKYAHLHDDPVAAAAERVGTALAGALMPRGSPVPIDKLHIAGGRGE